MPMVKVASWVFAVLMAACGVVYGAAGKKPSDKLAQWSSVEALPPDALIEVGREGQAGVDVCRIESADDSMLTCVSEHPEGDARLVFPRGTVQNVWLMERAKDRHIGRWIVAGVGIAVIVAVCVEGGILGFVTVGVLVLGVESSYFEDSVRSRPPQIPRMRWRLIYSVP
jgi:hypothetical protein